jgi:hypothetical protein
LLPKSIETTPSSSPSFCLSVSLCLYMFLTYLNLTLFSDELREESVVPEEHRNNPLFKSVLCKNKDNCTYGESCVYAHDESELRPVKVSFLSFSLSLSLSLSLFLSFFLSLFLLTFPSFFFLYFVCLSFVYLLVVPLFICIFACLSVCLSVSNSLTLFSLSLSFSIFLYFLCSYNTY